MFAQAPDDEFAREVRAGLAHEEQKTLPCRYLYDAVGSALFEAITCLPEYGLARADARLLERHAGDLVERMPRHTVVVELGSGSGAKTRPVLEHLRQRQAVNYYPVDVSATALARCARELAPFGTVHPLETGYLEGLREVAARRQPDEALLVLFLGSTIGNFQPEAAIDFLSVTRTCLLPGDALLLGTDLVKPIERMLAAYDDPAGVTAAFNLNLLARINRELGGDFDLRRFDHLARYHHQQQRVEMHLRSQAHQRVAIRAARLAVDFAAGETIWTEACHKFRPGQVRSMAQTAGYRLDEQWIDREWPFAESLLRAV